MPVGVAVKEGAPLMRLFKSNQAFRSEEDRAAGLRLENIASRYRVEPDPEAEPSPVASEEDPASAEPPR